MRRPFWGTRQPRNCKSCIDTSFVEVCPCEERDTLAALHGKKLVLWNACSP